MENPTIESAMSAVLSNLHTLSGELERHPQPRDIDQPSIAQEMVNLTIVLRNLYDLKVKASDPATVRAERLKEIREHGWTVSPSPAGLYDSEGKQVGFAEAQHE